MDWQNVYEVVVALIIYHTVDTILDIVISVVRHRKESAKYVASSRRDPRW